MMRWFAPGVVWGLLLGGSPCFAGDLGEVSRPPTEPRNVRWKGAGYRYAQHGWIILHIEGKPYERGLQHGYLLADEVIGYLKCFAAQQGSKAPQEAWQQTRTLVNALFLRKFDREYLEEMRGIADGVSEAGARFEGRKIDLIDVAAINLWAEIDTLDSALEATPQGLEGVRFPREGAKTPVPTPMDHCSAFAATGPATADGKIVFGHITMFSLYPSNYYNVWLDVKPADGHRVVMQTYPGGIQSGMDYYLNDRGILLTETTIRQTRFNGDGAPLASRVRKAMQYADSIDGVVETLSQRNNGLYTNEWLLGDTKTNEIALFELGTNQTKLMRSSKQQWFGGTEGFYWGCNNTKDLQVRLDAMASLLERPQNVAWRPSERDKAWLNYYAQHKGKIDPQNARRAFTTAPLAAYSSLDAKITTTALAKNLESLAMFGPPLGNIWEPTDGEKHDYPEVRPLIPNPWTRLAPVTPPHSNLQVVDRKRIDGGEASAGDRPTAWHGTLLPKTTRDLWLTGAFAEYERLHTLEQHLAADGSLSPEDQQQLAVARFAHRAALFDRPVSATAAEAFDLEHDRWSRAEVARGVYFLDTLQRQMGAVPFVACMEKLGDQFAGKEITTADFEKFLDANAPPGSTALLRRMQAPPTREAPAFRVKVESLTAQGTPRYRLIGSFTPAEAGAKLPTNLELTVTGGEKELTLPVRVNEQGVFQLECDVKPTAVELNRYQRAMGGPGAAVSTTRFTQDLANTVIVYGTLDDADAQREAADRLHLQIRRAMYNYRVRVISDVDYLNNPIADQHLILIGTPRSNAVARKHAAQFPVRFEGGTFEVERSVYAHEDSGVICVAPHRDEPGRTLLLAGGLSAQATYRTAGAIGRGLRTAEILVFTAGGSPQARVRSGGWVGTLE